MRPTSYSTVVLYLTNSRKAGLLMISKRSASDGLQDDVVSALPPKKARHGESPAAAEDDVGDNMYRCMHISLTLLLFLLDRLLTVASSLMKLAIKKSHWPGLDQVRNVVVL